VESPRAAFQAPGQPQASAAFLRFGFRLSTCFESDGALGIGAVATGTCTPNFAAKSRWAALVRFLTPAARIVFLVRTDFELFAKNPMIAGDRALGSALCCSRICEPENPRLSQRTKRCQPYACLVAALRDLDLNLRRLVTAASPLEPCRVATLATLLTQTKNTGYRL
jgi:hypothetical protein